MSQEENRFGIKKPEQKPPVQTFKAVVNILMVGSDKMYLNLPFRNIFIPIDPKHIGIPKEVQKAQEEYSKYQEDTRKYNEDLKRLNIEYNKEFQKEFEKEQKAAQAAAIEKAQKKVKKGFKDRLGL